MVSEGSTTLQVTARRSVKKKRAKRQSRINSASLQPIYAPLSNGQIRILEIVSNSGPKVVCRLITVALEETPLFTALSYVWGDPNNTEAIIVGGHSVFVTKTLASALRHVKRHWQTIFPSRTSTTFRLWADALCINQADPRERGHQVKLMKHIYTAAEIVFCWLGDEHLDTLELAMETVVTIASATKDLSFDCFATFQWIRFYPSLLKVSMDGQAKREPLRNTKWAAISSLLSLAYWRRVWIFQEIILGKTRMLACPSLSIPYNLLARISDSFQMVQNNYFNSRHERPVFIPESIWTLISCEIPFHVISIAEEYRTTLWQPQYSMNDIARRCCLHVVPSAWHFQATDPKDYIYGLLGLSGLELEPDYCSSKTLGQVYEDYVSAWLAWKQTVGANCSVLATLFFLLFAGWVPGDHAEVPSWAPLYHNNNTRAQFHWASLRDADKGFPDTKKAFISDSCLVVEGIRVALVSRAVPIEFTLESTNFRFSEGRVLQDCSLLLYIQEILSRQRTYMPTETSIIQTVFLLFRRNGSTTATRENVLHSLAVLHFLIISGAQVGQTAENVLLLLGLEPRPESFGDSFIANIFPGGNLEQCGLGDDLFSSLFLGENGSLAASIRKIRTDLSRYTAWCRIAETSGIISNHLAMVPRSTVVGDVVCVLKGCGAPVVLRQIGEDWAHIGCCTVPGIMEGEATSLLENGHAKVERFYIG